MSPKRAATSESPWFYPPVPRAVSLKAPGKPQKETRGNLCCLLVVRDAKVKFWGPKGKT